VTSPRRHLRILVPAAGLACALALWAAGCSPNDPFDPDSVPNRPPTVRLSVGPVEPGGELNPTSYFERTFNWSGTDADGFVTEFYVSIRTDAAVPAPWDTTTRTDTTMTFTTDDQGEAEATFLLACRDDRGALSDTVVQFIPLKNFPPVIGFQSDFDPLRNLQREFRDADGNPTTDGSAAVDTVFWNWGPMNFRLSASDPDGRRTMDPFYRYTLADALPDSTYDLGDPRANPEDSWVRVPFETEDQFAFFDILFTTVLPGTRTLTVSVRDEAGSDPMFRYTWEVRAPRGPVLYIPDASSTATRAFYTEYLDTAYGAGGWETYAFWKGFPDDPAVLLHTMRKFALVLWTDTGTSSNNLKFAGASGGVLTQLLRPTDGAEPGRFLMVSRVLSGTRTGLGHPFLQEIVGVSPTGAPPSQLRMQPDKQALGLAAHLPAATSTRTSNDAGIGLKILDGADNEILYRMEECRECYGDPRRPAPPFDPIVAVRAPSRATRAEAWMVGISLQFDEFVKTEVFAVLDAVITVEMGVNP